MGLQFPPSGFTDRTAARAGVRYASWLRRAGGVLIDLLILSMINYLIINVLVIITPTFPGVSGLWGIFVILSIFSVVDVVYATLCLTRLQGQTPGMRVMQVRCVHVSQRGRITMPQALTRSLVADLLVAIPLEFRFRYPYLVIVPLLAYLWPLIDQRRQTWWDHAAVTVVLDDRGW
ncbi:MAG TPA: RDD family protein [Acidimicrobiales bacterium]|jgi:uncharacterized RDD family membrane protein YckC